MVACGRRWSSWRPSVELSHTRPIVKRYRYLLQTTVLRLSTQSITDVKADSDAKYIIIRVRVPTERR